MSTIYKHNLRFAFILMTLVMGAAIILPSEALGSPQNFAPKANFKAKGFTKAPGIIKKINVGNTSVKAKVKTGNINNTPLVSIPINVGKTPVTSPVKSVSSGKTSKGTALVLIKNKVQTAISGKKALLAMKRINSLAKLNTSVSMKTAGLSGFVAPSIIKNGIITSKLNKAKISGNDVATVDLHGDGLIEIAVANKQSAKAIIKDGIVTEDGEHIMMNASAGKEIVDNLITIDDMYVSNAVSVKNGKIVLYNGTKAPHPQVNEKQFKTNNNHTNKNDGKDGFLGDNNAGWKKGVYTPPSPPPPSPPPSDGGDNGNTGGNDTGDTGNNDGTPPVTPQDVILPDDTITDIAFSTPDNRFILEANYLYTIYSYIRNTPNTPKFNAPILSGKEIMISLLDDFYIASGTLPEGQANSPERFYDQEDDEDKNSDE